jgi:hypothetical protein
MRILMRASFPVESGNLAIREGKFERLLGDTVSRLNPEATYFYPEGGKRTCLMVFDLADSSQMPLITEPFFMQMNATVEMFPVMNQDDLKRGLESLKGQMAAQR